MVFRGLGDIIVIVLWLHLMLVNAEKIQPLTSALIPADLFSPQETYEHKSMISCGVRFRIFERKNQHISMLAMQYETSSGDCVIGAIIDPRRPTICLTKSVEFATNDDPGKQCVFPFTHNDGTTYNECKYDPNGSDVHPWCGTALDGTTSTYGFCNSACPGGVFVGPSDVGGICPPGVETVNKNGVEHCCCGSSSCCWASCTDTVLPMDCLPPGAEWTYNNNGYYVAVQAAPSNPASISTSTYVNNILELYINEDVRDKLFNVETSTSNPSSCTAMDANGPAECKFPFKDPTGTVHNECTDVGYEGRGLTWCATELQADGITMTGDMRDIAFCCCPDCPTGLSATNPSTDFLLYYLRVGNGNFAALKDDPLPQCMEGEVALAHPNLYSPALFMGPNYKPRLCGGTKNRGACYELKLDNANTWQEKGSTLYQGAERAWDFSAEIGVLVIAGGENSSTYIDSVEMSNDLGDSFTELAPLPKSLKNGCLVIAGQTIFHAGGRTSASLHTVVDNLYIMTPGAVTWSNGSQMLQAKCHHSCGLVSTQSSGQEIVLVGGTTGTGEANKYSRSVQIYNIDGNIWRQAASEFTVAIRSMGWTRYEDSFLIAGGRGNSGKLDNIYRYVAGNETWEKMDVKLSQKGDFPSIMIVGNLCNTPDASNLMRS